MSAAAFVDTALPHLTSVSVPSGVCDAMTTDNTMYPLMEKAIFANMTVEIG